MNNKTWVAVLGLILGAALGVARAEDAAPASGDAAAAPAAADPAAPAAEGSGSAGGDSGADAPAVPVKPRPAEIMGLAAQSMLLDVEKTDDHYVAVGDRGDIVTSTDGKTWKQVNVPVRAALTAVSFADPQHGWAVGHDATIVVTADGGSTWALQNFKPELEKPLLDVLALSNEHVLAVGAYGLFVETTDGGKTWNDVTAPAVRGDELHLNSITKLGNGDLLIAGEQGMLALSKDQGKTWNKLKAPYESSLFGALPRGDKGALIYGLRGNVFVTSDVAGGKWTTVKTESVATMFGGTNLKNGAAALVGLNGVVFLIGGDNSVNLLKSPSGTPLSAALPLGDGLLAVGESGVQNLSLAQ